MAKRRRGTGRDRNGEGKGNEREVVRGREDMFEEIAEGEE